jgi:hypothetical protein
MSSHTEPVSVAKSVAGALAPAFDRRPWLVMLAVNAALMAALVIYKYNADYPVIQYSYLLATYHFGFMKRAMLGSVFALFGDRLPIAAVFIAALSVWLLTMALFVLLFKRTFGFAGDRLALFVFAFGSPFFFKNYFHTFGFFDIYGCLFAVVVLLIPANRLFPLIVSAGCTLLVLIHHLHFLLFLPTIAVIAAIRFHCLRPLSKPELVYSALAAVPPCIAMLASTMFGNAAVPPDVLLNEMRTRALDPLPNVNITIWYTSATDELAKTMAQLPKNLPRLPVFAVLFALHWPLIRFMRALYAGIGARAHRRTIAVGLIGIAAGYLVIFIFVFDYARWFSSAAVCMILLMHAMAQLQRRDGDPASPFLKAGKEKRDLACGWAVTAIPRVGLQIPF